MGEATTWTMDGGDVAVSLDGLVARVAIERPAALNALNRSVLEQLDEAWTRVEQSGARALVVTGAGRAFVAGADIAQMKAMGREEAREFSQFGNAVFRRLERLPVPSVAAVNGFALGGGCELALACDIRLASQAAVFGQPEVGLGITPGFGGTQRLARLVGSGVASELVFSGVNIDAGRALAIGLANAVYPASELLDAAAKLAARIAAQAPIAVRAAKAALRAGLETDIDSGLALEAEAFASCFGTADQQEGMAAFLEKRKAAGFIDA